MTHHRSHPTDDAKRKVLVVDDCRDTTEGFARLLTAWGHDARIAHDGREALDIAGKQHPDVVLLDLGLPGMNGHEVARRLRHDGCESSLIVVLSGYGDDEDRRESKRAGCDLHLIKPVDPLELQRLIAGPMVIARATRERAGTALPREAATAGLRP